MKLPAIAGCDVRRNFYHAAGQPSSPLAPPMRDSSICDHNSPVHIVLFIFRPQLNPAMPHDSDTRSNLVVFAFVLLLLQARIPGFAQSDPTAFRPDPTLDIVTPTLESAVHTPLPEQYIWSGDKGDAGETTFLYFRKTLCAESCSESRDALRRGRQLGHGLP